MQANKHYYVKNGATLTVTGGVLNDFVQLEKTATLQVKCHTVNKNVWGVGSDGSGCGNLQLGCSATLKAPIGQAPSTA